MINGQGIAFEVAPPSLGYAVAVVLGNAAGRWVAAAQCPDGHHVAIGATASQALTAALAPLGTRAAAILLADPALFGASVGVLAS